MPATATTARQDKTAEALAMLDTGVSQLLDSDAYRQWLTVVSKLHRYSWGNCLLIAMQKPDATMIAGYSRWQELKRQVRKGERGIRILAPMLRTVEDEHGDRAPIVRGFRSVAVFDVSQTEGDELPTPPMPETLTTTSNQTARLSDALTRWLAAEGITVSRTDTGRANGTYSPSAHHIDVHTRLDGDAALKTLTHEAAHYAALHTKGMPAADAETVAESAAFVVLHAHGIDTSAYSFAYVAHWAEDRDRLTRNLAAIQTVAHRLLAAIDTTAEQIDTNDDDTADLAIAA